MERQASEGRVALAVHGGAWNISADLHAAHRAGCAKALRAGWAILSEGGPALAAAVSAVRVMEDDPAFDAGVGSFLNRDGEVELDAAVMDGRDLSCGAVAAVRALRNPVLLAEEVRLQGGPVLMVGEGALRLAHELKLKFCDPAELIVPRERERWELARRGALEADPFGDTVGAIARDLDGHLAVATSTGGSMFKRPGRVGDTPLVGCGFYADDRVGAALCTGHGESIARLVLAKQATDFLAMLPVEEAAAAALQQLRVRLEGRAGVLVMDKLGRVGWCHSTPYMAVALIDSERTAPRIALDQHEV
ncbi:MAG TPA: isoaspartyl peptidase/L-asparaginase family protein [Acidobacteriota bacterium]